MPRAADSRAAEGRAHSKTLTREPTLLGSRQPFRFRGAPKRRSGATAAARSEKAWRCSWVKGLVHTSMGQGPIS